MVEYAYPELFEEHESVHFIIVNSDATVTSVSESEPSISDNDFLITEEDMKQEAFSLTESVCSQDNLKFGLSESSRFEFTIFNSSSIPSLKDKEISIYIYFNEDSDTLFQVGTYIVKEDTYSADRAFREVSGYDVLNLLHDYDITEWYNAFYEEHGTSSVLAIRNSLFAWLAEEEDEYTIEQETASLISDSYLIEKSIDSDVITFGSFMEDLMDINGVFMHVKRNGKIGYIQLQYYSVEPVKVYNEENTFPPVRYTDYSTWAIGFVKVFNGNKRLFKVGSTSKKHPSNYKIIDSFVFSNKERRYNWEETTKTMLENLRTAITSLNYKPCEFTAIGNLCVEAGDRINYAWVSYDENDTPTNNRFRTYMLERTFSGIQGFKDTIVVRGDMKQPKYVYNKDDKFSTDDTETGTTGEGTGGVATIDDEHDRRVIAIMRNYGEPMLDEPVVDLVYNKADGQVEIKWTDPSDITSYSPLPIEWVGTEVVRKEGSAPLHGWSSVDAEYGGIVLVTSTTRDEYSENAYVDDTIEANKRYYYAIRPYYIKLDDEDHPIKQYRWTKIISVDTQRILVAPTITALQADGTSVTALYLIPALEVGTYASIKLAAKKGGIPTSLADADKVMDIPEPSGLIPIGTATMGGLDELSTYYFVIFVEDELGNTAYSDAVECVTGKRKGIFTMNITATQGIKDNGFKEVIEITQT